MNPETFAEWQRQQGRRVVRTQSSFWHLQGTRTYQAFPYHWLILPSQEELAEFLKSNKAIALRYSTPIEAPIGQISYHVVYSNATYGFEDLSKWTRKNIRRGLKNCSVEQISFRYLADHGWKLHLDTLKRQARASILSRVDWERCCMSAGDLAGFEAWGALVEGRLAASVITLRLDDCWYLFYQQCDCNFMQAHVNNALSFTVTQNLLQRGHSELIFYCLHSLDARPSMDEFKFRMGYGAKPVRQRVVFHPKLVPLVNSATHAMVRTLRTLRPKSHLLSKADGMMHFYIQGKKPLARQVTPEPVTHLDQYEKLSVSDSILTSDSNSQLSCNREHKDAQVF